MIRFAMLRGALCGGLGIALRVSPPLAAVSRPSRRGGGGYFKLSVLSHTKLQERLDTMAETQTPDIIYTQVDEAPELASYSLLPIILSLPMRQGFLWAPVISLCRGVFWRPSPTR